MFAWFVRVVHHPGLPVRELCTLIRRPFHSDAADIVACRSGVSQIEQLIRSGDFGSAASLLGKPPFSSFKQNALVLVNSKLLTPEDIKAIGTEKRFGVGADVLLMLGGLADATERSDKSGALDYATKAKSSLDEIIAIGRGAGL
eukprot:scaffold227000_cov26-Tisochrysis_lutea.AAC.1